jgi:hypothetical protein
LGPGLPSLEPGTPIEYPNRVTSFNGSTSQAIVLFHDPPRCLKVVDPANDRFLPVKPLHIKEALPLSRLNLILPKPVSEGFPLGEIFGPEPAHNWCYHFQKADLYRQLGDWPKAAAAADQALKIDKHITRKNVSELLPFIEAYAHTGQWEKAVELSLKSYNFWEKTQFILCDVWDNIARMATPDAEGLVAIDYIQEELQCTKP